MEERKYKIGDELEIIELVEDAHSIKIGDRGYVIRIDEEDDYPIRLNINDLEDYGVKYEEVDYVNRKRKENKPVVKDNVKEINIKRIPFNMFISNVDISEDDNHVIIFDVSLYISDINRTINRKIKVLTYNNYEERYKTEDEIKDDLTAEVKQQVREIYIVNKKFNLSQYINRRYQIATEVME